VIKLNLDSFSRRTLLSGAGIVKKKVALFAGSSEKFDIKPVSIFTQLMC